MKNRKREICTSGTVRDEDGNVLIYSANDRGDRRNVGIIRSPVAYAFFDLGHCIFSGNDRDVYGECKREQPHAQ
jgi:hypothetical protein